MFKALAQNFDTIECAYYLARTNEGGFDFENLAVKKEELSRAKIRKPRPIKLGSEEFLLASHGTASGYSFLLENEVFSVQLGEFVKPNFFVKFKSIALWHHGAFALHERFMKWATSIGMQPYQKERISRVDFAFDYFFPEIDFDEDNFVSQSRKDNQHRKNGKIQTLKFGTDQVVLRIYNKTDEIEEVSHKTWLYPIWGTDQNVWRIEWQVRKEMLRHMDIMTFDCLKDSQGDLLRELVKRHTTLRIKSTDTNRSRWAMHPLWLDLIDRVNEMQGLGIVRSLDEKAILEERLRRIAVSIYGYLKRIAAIDSLRRDVEDISIDNALRKMEFVIREIHDPLTWQQNINRLVNEMRLGND